MRYALRDVNGWHRDYGPCLWRNRATVEQKQIDWEIWVRMEKIIAVVLHEVHLRQVEVAIDALEEGPETFVCWWINKRGTTLCTPTCLLRPPPRRGKTPARRTS